MRPRLNDPRALGKSLKDHDGYIKDPFIRKLKRGFQSEKPETHTPDESWGYHLLMDCLEMDDEIDNEDDIRRFFEELIEALDMVPLTEFFCVRVNDGANDRGISAFQMITTSHIAMHFDDDGHNGFMDVFSCKKFDPRIVMEMVKKHFKPKNMMIQFVYRDTGVVIGPDDKDNPEMHNTL